MKACKRIAEIVILYFILFVIINMIFSLAYHFVGISNGFSYEKVLLYSISDNLDMRLFDDEKWLILVDLQQFLEVVCTSVMTGFILKIILTREPRIFFPDKLVIRHTTQDDKKVLSLGVLVGNSNKNVIYDAGCIMQFIYKSGHGNSKIVDKKENVFFIENFCRFSFDLKSKVSYRMLEHIIDTMKEGENAGYNDEINVSITGHFITKGNAFLVSRKYTLKDIVIVKDEDPEFEIYKNSNRRRKLRYADWKKINQFNEAEEDEKRKIIEEMEAIKKKRVIPDRQIL
ncbi:MAG: hypothetical protein HDQ95_05220 [Roseburia sp.]|nr:hypothetical protein [Roseburia sp.]